MWYGYIMLPFKKMGSWALSWNSCPMECGLHGIEEVIIGWFGNHTLHLIPTSLTVCVCMCWSMIVWHSSGCLLVLLEQSCLDFGNRTVGDSLFETKLETNTRGNVYNVIANLIRLLKAVQEEMDSPGSKTEFMVAGRHAVVCWISGRHAVVLWISFALKAIAFVHLAVWL